MKHPSQEDLLGYVLGALDASEQREIQQLIDQNPEIEEELLRIKSSLLPLDELDSGKPRPGLARRTCEAVATHVKQDGLVANQDAEEVEFHPAASDPKAILESALAAADPAAVDSQSSTQPKPKVMLPVHERIFSPSSWSISDVLASVAIMAVMASVLFPALSYSRYNSRLFACQNNMREIGNAMLKYSDINDGMFVTIPSSGNLSAAGSYAPILKQAGLIEDDSTFACAGVASQTAPVHIPSCELMTTNKVPESQLNHWRRSMGGHYGYTMGYVENEQYCPPRNMGRTNVVLLADQPSIDLEGRRSANHCGNGQNCLFEDGHVEFVKGHTYGSDALFENDYGVVAPGSHAADNVIAPSHLSIKLAPRD